MVPDPELTLAQGAVAPWSMGHNAEYFTRMLSGLGEALGFDTDTPWRKLPLRRARRSSRACDEQVHVRYQNRYGRTRSYYADFEGVMASPAAPHGADRVRADEGALRGLHA